MDPGEIWQLILKADEARKYATEDKAAVRKEQAVGHLREALREAEAGGHDALADQARTRLRDLGADERG